MYTAFYGLREKPFVLSPDPRYLFLAEAHREALAHLLYGIDEGEGFIAITGEVGTGKTTLCRTLLQRLGHATEVAFLFNPTISSLELMQAVNAEFGMPLAGRSLRDLHAQLNEFLLARKREGRRVLLIIDEAQNLAPETLEQVRLLSNLETETQKLLQIVLIGQPELEAKLASPELRQLRQRISVHWRLDPLSPGETGEYVLHRLRIAAGAEREIFSQAALRELHRRARGVPRVVNVLCDRALLAGYAARAREIGARLVKQADREVNPAPPVAGRRARARWRPWAAALLVLLAGAAVGFAWQQLGPGVGLPFARPAAAPPDASSPSVSSAPEPVPSAIAAPLPPPDLGAWLDGQPGGSFETGLAELGADEPRAHVFGSDGSNLVVLQVLNRPAVLAMAAPDGYVRHVVLRELAGDRARFAPGEGDGDGYEAGLDELGAHWTGALRVVWRDFEALPGRIAFGASGSKVTWLQGALTRLGLYAGPATGRFDAATQAAVVAFQRTRHLTPDGVLGPVTKMALYDALGGYPVAHLTPEPRG
jgi:general secretion pathway protein A